MSGNGRVALPDVWEWSGAFPNVRELSEGPRIPGSGGTALPDVREWSGCLPGCPGAFERPHGYSGVVERLSQMSGSG